MHAIKDTPESSNLFYTASHAYGKSALSSSDKRGPLWYYRKCVFPCMPIKAYSLARLADIRLEFSGFRNSNLILSSTKEPDGFVQLEN